MPESSLDFETVCREVLNRAGEISAFDRDCIIEDLKLRFQYPNQYIAFIDGWRTVDGVRRLSRRVVAHSADLAELQEPIARLSQRDHSRLIIDFVHEYGADEIYMSSSFLGTEWES